MFHSISEFETTGREAKRHKEIVGQHRLTKQAELKTRQGGSSFEPREKLKSEPPSPQVHFHGLPGAIKKAGLTGFTRPYNKDQTPKEVHPANRHIKIIRI